MHGRAPITIADRNGEHDRPMPIDDQADGVSEAIALVATINRQAATRGRGDAMSHVTIDDDEDWIDIERSSPQSKHLAECEVSVKAREETGRIRVSIVLRRAAASWVADNGPRFRVQIGGAGLNLVRITPDAMYGQFEAGNFRGTYRLVLGHMTLWPCEDRSHVEASMRLSGGAMILELPADFAKPTREALTREERDLIVRPKPEPFPITTAAPGLSGKGPKAAELAYGIKVTEVVVA